VESAVRKLVVWASLGFGYHNPAISTGMGSPQKNVHYCRKWMEETMSHRTFSLVVGVVFLLIAVGHLVRVILGATFVIEGMAVPMRPSVLAVILTGYLAFEGFRLSSKR